jgi:hypothetical protein
MQIAITSNISVRAFIGSYYKTIIKESLTGLRQDAASRVKISGGRGNYGTKQPEFRKNTGQVLLEFK